LAGFLECRLIFQRRFPPATVRRLNANGSVNLAGAGAGFDISAAANQTTGASSGVGGSSVLLGANTLTLASSTSQALGGSISGAGGLIKQGSGTLTVSGNYSQASSATLAIEVSPSAGSSVNAIGISVS
jgi:fibronectin-binding autotransporter adhesin